MAVIENGNLKGVVPDKALFAVNYPGYPASIPRVVETLGGKEAILKARSSETNYMELRFRPEDPYAHPVFGELHGFSGLLLELSVEEDKEKGSQVLRGEITAKVDQLYEFGGLADYQYIAPVHAKLEKGRKRRRLQDIRSEIFGEQLASHGDGHPFLNLPSSSSSPCKAELCSITSTEVLIVRHTVCPACAEGFLEHHSGRDPGTPSLPSALLFAGYLAGNGVDALRSGASRGQIDGLPCRWHSRPGIYPNPSYGGATSGRPSTLQLLELMSFLSAPPRHRLSIGETRRESENSMFHNFLSRRGLLHDDDADRWILDKDSGQLRIPYLQTDLGRVLRRYAAQIHPNSLQPSELTRASQRKALLCQQPWERAVYFVWGFVLQGSEEFRIIQINIKYGSRRMSDFGAPFIIAYKQRKQMAPESSKMGEIRMCLLEDFEGALNAWEGHELAIEVLILVQALMDRMVQYALNVVILFFLGKMSSAQDEGQ
ncbi:hypothetical protein L7F22_050508 [Adiantum nelumboides]|nr:hypothetical protein [Adiantum nelumboides]